MYKFAEKAVEKYNRKIKIFSDKVEVYQITHAAQIDVGIKKFRFHLLVMKPICTKQLGNICYYKLEVEVTHKIKDKFKVDTVEKLNSPLQNFPMCHFPVLNVDKIIPK